MADDRAVRLIGKKDGRRFASPIYVAWTSVFAGFLLIAAVVLGASAERSLWAWIGVAAALPTLARLCWVAWRGGALLDTASERVTVRGLLSVSRLSRSEVTEVQIHSRGGTGPRGALRGGRGVFLRGLSFRHTHRLGGGGLSCPDCFADRQAMINLATALERPVVESD